MCVCGRGWGYSDIFIYIRRLGPFLGVQKYHYFWVFEDFVNISLQTGLVLGVISIHFRGFFLRSMCRMGI